MYEYRFIRVDLSAMTRSPKADYHDIIQYEADQGWELVQIFAPAVSGYGAASFYEIIMKRPKE